MRHNISAIGRRDLLGVAITAFIVPVSWRPAGAQITDAASAQMPIERLDGALLVAMKAGDRTPFTERYRALAPVVEQVFNLDAVLAASVGLSWATLPEAQKADLATAFRRYTISSYVSNFNSYNGQSFQILPSVRTVATGEVVVQTRLVRVNDPPVELELRRADRPRGMAGGGRADERLDQSCRRAALRFS